MGPPQIIVVAVGDGAMQLAIVGDVVGPIFVVVVVVWRGIASAAGAGEVVDVLDMAAVAGYRLAAADGRSLNLVVVV